MSRTALVALSIVALAVALVVSVGAPARAASASTEIEGGARVTRIQESVATCWVVVGTRSNSVAISCVR